jgi:hypothetical protein
MYQVRITLPYGQGRTVTDFPDASSALDYAMQHSVRPQLVRIHDTDSGHWLNIAQFHRFVKTGSAFGPLVPQPDGSIL